MTVGYSFRQKINIFRPQFTVLIRNPISYSTRQMTRLQCTWGRRAECSAMQYSPFQTKLIASWMSNEVHYKFFRRAAAGAAFPQLMVSICETRAPSSLYPPSDGRRVTTIYSCPYRRIFLEWEWVTLTAEAPTESPTLVHPSWSGHSSFNEV